MSQNADIWLNTAIFEKKLSQFGSKEDMPCGACPTV
jgi:hypothetical protein